MSADLSHANLARAILERADLEVAHLNYANLSDANLTDSSLIGANFNCTNLAGADLNSTVFQNTAFANVDLTSVRGLDTARHLGPSTLGTDTILKSRGTLPELFLRGAGVPESFITFMGSPVGTVFDFYSCFISHSSKDHEFAKRLHADLQCKGVRCWFAPEDLKIGAKLRPAFDEAIRSHDKLMVILSERSVKSPWVEKEVETAFEKERQQNSTVLFPIRLDDAVMDSNEAWAADIRRTRHIGDFRNWNDSAAYERAFDRLLRDLKAESKAKSSA